MKLTKTTIAGLLSPARKPSIGTMTFRDSRSGSTPRAGACGCSISHHRAQAGTDDARLGDGAHTHRRPVLACSV